MLNNQQQASDALFTTLHKENLKGIQFSCQTFFNLSDFLIKETNFLKEVDVLITNDTLEILNALT